VWAAILAVAIALAGVPYPFLPRQITLAGSLTIGIPAFFLALGPNTRRYQPGFVRRVGRFVLPAGALTALAVLATYALANASGASLAEARSLCTITLVITGLGVLAAIEWPLGGWRLALVAAMAGAAVVVFLVPPLREFFALELRVDAPLAETLVAAFVACAGIFWSYRATRP
jgi:cation-transporting ATPase E